FLMIAANRYYDRVTPELEAAQTRPTMPASAHSVLLVSRLHKPALRALGFARDCRAGVWEAVTMATDHRETRELVDVSEQRGLPGWRVRRDGRRCGAGATSSGGGGRRASSHQRARLPPRQAMAGRRGAARRRDHGAVHGEHPAFGVPA